MDSGVSTGMRPRLLSQGPEVQAWLFRLHVPHSIRTRPRARGARFLGTLASSDVVTFRNGCVAQTGLETIQTRFRKWIALRRALR